MSQVILQCWTERMKHLSGVEGCTWRFCREALLAFFRLEEKTR